MPALRQTDKWSQPRKWMASNGVNVHISDSHLTATWTMSIYTGMPKRRTLRQLNLIITAISIRYPRQEPDMHSAQIEDNSNKNSNNSTFILTFISAYVSGKHRGPYKQVWPAIHICNVVMSCNACFRSIYVSFNLMGCLLILWKKVLASMVSWRLWEEIFPFLSG